MYRFHCKVIIIMLACVYPTAEQKASVKKIQHWFDHTGLLNFAIISLLTIYITITSDRSLKKLEKDHWSSKLHQSVGVFSLYRSCPISFISFLHVSFQHFLILLQVGLFTPFQVSLFILSFYLLQKVLLIFLIKFGWYLLTLVSILQYPIVRIHTLQLYTK